MEQSSSGASAPAESLKNLSWPYYLLGVTALIPYLGVLTGFAAFILGIIHFKRGGWILILLFLAGLGVTGGVAYFTYYQIFVNRGGAMGQAFKKVEEDNLTLLVKDIEVYKLTHGQYPKALTDLPQDALKHAVDLGAGLDFKNFKDKDKLWVIYDLQPDGQTYFLFSRGPDGQGFTADDLFPRIDAAEASKLGYRERPLNPGGVGTPAH